LRIRDRRAVLLLLLVVLAAFSFIRNSMWLDRIGLLEDTARKSPNSSRAHYNLANAYLAADRNIDAAQEFEHALSLNPGLAYASYVLGNLYYSQGRLNEALANYQSALMHKPDSWYAAYIHNGLGNVQLGLGNTEQAIIEYQTAVALSPVYAEAYANQGNAFAKQGRILEAKKAYEAALALNPNLSLTRRSLEALGHTNKHSQQRK